PCLFTGQLFSYIAADSAWEASSSVGIHAPLYWPPGALKLDFLALACTPAAYGDLGPDGQDLLAWEAVPANGFTIEGWDTYAGQYDVMYAARNGQDSTGAVDLVFRHSMAVLAFTVQCSEEQAFTINAISIDGLEYRGSFTVANDGTELTAVWEDMAAGADRPVKGADPAHGQVLTAAAAPFGDHLLVPPQPSKSITVNYSLPHSEIPSFNHTIHLARTFWQAGYKYTYALRFSPTEISVSPSVGAWDADEADVILP
ncbi:MAG: fimbrillin family protein, partial [Bacteroidales bacterium]|nr:fimbrillin family protein [Bacteroidales bacterium]